MTAVTPETFTASDGIEPAALAQLLADHCATVGSLGDVAGLGDAALTQILLKRHDRHYLADLIGCSLVPPSVVSYQYSRPVGLQGPPLMDMTLVLIRGWHMAGLEPGLRLDDFLAVVALELVVASALVILTARGKTKALLQAQEPRFAAMLRQSATAYRAATAGPRGKPAAKRRSTPARGARSKTKS